MQVLVSSINVYSSDFCVSNVAYSMRFQAMHAQTHCTCGKGKSEWFLGYWTLCILSSHYLSSTVVSLEPYACEYQGSTALGGFHSTNIHMVSNLGQVQCYVRKVSTVPVLKDSYGLYSTC
jgi:hypothetical protein